jgi:hypothetical protein
MMHLIGAGTSIPKLVTALFAQLVSKGTIVRHDNGVTLHTSRRDLMQQLGMAIGLCLLFDIKLPFLLADPQSLPQIMGYLDVILLRLCSGFALPGFQPPSRRWRAFLERTHSRAPTEVDVAESGLAMNQSFAAFVPNIQLLQAFEACEVLR